MTAILWGLNQSEVSREVETRGCKTDVIIISLLSSNGCNITFLIVAIPRQNIVHDIFSFVACGVTTPRLIEECPDLLSLRPTTQEIQVASIRAIPIYRYDKFEIF